MSNEDVQDFIKALGVVVLLIGAFFAIMAVATLIVPILIVGALTLFSYMVMKDNKKNGPR